MVFFVPGSNLIHYEIHTKIPFTAVTPGIRILNKDHFIGSEEEN